jgi:hypothetical protein
MKRRLVEEIRITRWADDEPKRERPQRESRRELRARREREGGGMTSQRNPRGFQKHDPTEQPYFDGRAARGDHHHDDDGGHEPEEFV